MNYIKLVREILKDPRKKSLVKLGIYFIFFIFVFILLKGAGNNTSAPIIEKEKTSMESFNDMNSYNYKVTYTNIDKIDVIEGTYYDNKSLFNFNNIKYYYEDILYIIDNDSYYVGNIEYNISKIFNKNLYNIINNLEEESKTTYKDGTVITNYIIDSNKIYNYLFGTESFYENNVTISVKENLNEIHNIVLDLTNLGLNLTKIEIEYSYIDEITSLSFNKDNYIFKESL